MKKRVVLFASVVALMLFLIACGKQKEEVKETIADAESSASAGDMLVDGLEYLLSEDKEDLLTISGDGTEATQEETGSTEETAEQTPEEQEEVQDTEEQESTGETIQVYYSNGSTEELNMEETEVEEKTPETVLAALGRHNIVSIDTKVLSFTEEDQAGEKILHLDLSGAFREYLKTMTNEAESIIIASVADTYLDNYQATEIYITVEGEQLQTGYRTYDMAIKKGTPDDILKLSEQEQDALNG